MRRRAFVSGLKPTQVPPPPDTNAAPASSVPTRFMSPELDAIIDELLMIDGPGRLTEVLAEKDPDGGSVERLRTRAGAQSRKRGSDD